MAQPTQADQPAETIPKKVRKTKSKSKDVVEDGMGGKLDTKDNTSKELGDGSTDFIPVTRDEQLRLKGSTKGSKSQNGSKSQKKGKTRGKGKAGKGKKKAPTKVAVGRKRKVLKVAEENADETSVKKTRTSRSLRSSSSKVATTEEVATSVDQPAKKEKLKEKQLQPKARQQRPSLGRRPRQKQKHLPRAKQLPNQRPGGEARNNQVLTSWRGTRNLLCLRLAWSKKWRTSPHTLTKSWM